MKVLPFVLQSCCFFRYPADLCSAVTRFHRKESRWYAPHHLNRVLEGRFILTSGADQDAAPILKTSSRGNAPEGSTISNAPVTKPTDQHDSNCCGVLEPGQGRS
eukprot:2633337-Rhodomonas_salina.2